MKKNILKNYVIGALLFLSLPIHSFATNSISNATQVLGAQLDVTKDKINNLITQLENRQETSGFKVNDYYRVAPVLQRDAELALEEFEFALENKIMPRLKFWMERYNSIFESSGLTKTQIDAVSSSQYQLLLAQVELISKIYQDEIFKIYQAMGNFIFDYWIKRYSYEQIRKDKGLKRKFKNLVGKNDSVLIFTPMRLQSGLGQIDAIGDSVIRSKRFYSNLKPRFITDLSPSSTEHYLKNKFPESFYKDFNNEIFDKISLSCESQLCVGLRAADLAFFIDMVRQNIDRPIHFSIRGGRGISLQPLRLNTSIISVFLKELNYPISLPLESE
ncbi:MAG: hypothetical protein AB8E15_02580 [Bdellovibrionales bacterium]